MPDARPAGDRERLYADAADAFGPAACSASTAAAHCGRGSTASPTTPPPPRRFGRLDARGRWWRFFTTVLFALMVIVEVVQIWIEEAPLERAGDALTIAALVYTGRHIRRHRMAAPAAALGSTSCAAFYRAELTRQRDLARDGWAYLIPFVPGVTLALLGRSLGERTAAEIVAIILFGVALFAGAAWWNAYTAGRLQREIDQLDASA